MKSFNYKSITLALAAVSAVSFCGAASAVNVNADGVGQTLIYPYYTARGDSTGTNTTLLSVVNTTSDAKIVRVRFRESKNSADVLDFNLFLSPYDVWTGAVVPSPSTVADAGARLITNDNSCTFPSKASWANLGGGTYAVDMFSDGYNSADSPNSSQTRDRTFEGYVEMIEMASISNTTSGVWVATKHNSSGVAPCTLDSDPTKSISWTGVASPTAQPYTNPPSGGLFGAVTFFGPKGTSTSVNATAMDGFLRTGEVTASNSAFPDVRDHNSCSATVTAGNTMYVVDTRAPLCDAAAQARAFSAALMASTVSGEYSYLGDTGSPVGTDWVVTHPGKYALTQGTATAPFTTPWDKAKLTACEPIRYASWDREEYRPGGTVGDGCFSGSSSASCAEKLTKLCHEANVISFGKESLTQGAGPTSAALLSKNALWLTGTQQLGQNTSTSVTKDGGWMALSFGNTAATANTLVTSQIAAFNISTGTAVGTAGTPLTHVGLPVIGFAASAVKTTAGPSINNYSASTNLTLSRTVK